MYTVIFYQMLFVPTLLNHMVNNYQQRFVQKKINRSNTCKKHAASVKKSSMKHPHGERHKKILHQENIATSNDTK